MANGHLNKSTGYFRPACYAVVRSGNRVALAKKTKGPFRGTYDLPGGGIRHGEEHIDALIRELDEEIGLKIRSQEAKILGIFKDLTDIRKNGEYVSSHMLAIVYEISVKEDLFCEIIQWKTIGSEKDSDAGERKMLHLSDIETLPLTPICKKALKSIAGQ